MSDAVAADAGSQDQVWQATDFAGRGQAVGRGVDVTALGGGDWRIGQGHRARNRAAARRPARDRRHQPVDPRHLDDLIHDGRRRVEATAALCGT